VAKLDDNQKEILKNSKRAIKIINFLEGYQRKYPAEIETLGYKKLNTIMEKMVYNLE